MKYPTWLGASSGLRSMTTFPAEVFTTACFPPISASDNGVVNGTCDAGFCVVGGAVLRCAPISGVAPTAKTAASAANDSGLIMAQGSRLRAQRSRLERGQDRRPDRATATVP